MIAAGRGEDCIATPKSILTGKIGRQVRVTGIGQIAVRGPTNKATFALRIVPARGFAVGNNRGNGLTWCLLPLLRRTRVTSAAARVPLIASSVVARLAIASRPLAASRPKLLLALILALILSLLISILGRLPARGKAGVVVKLLRQLLLREVLGRLR